MSPKGSAVELGLSYIGYECEILRPLFIIYKLMLWNLALIFSLQIVLSISMVQTKYFDSDNIERNMPILNFPY